jgi:hypothetical protein
MATINKKCSSDKDCNNNDICSFNENDYNHYCIGNKIENLYYGCLDINHVNKLNYIDSNKIMCYNKYK